MPKQIHNATLLEQAAGRHKCKDCGLELQQGDRITFTTDMRSMWHTKCFDANQTPIKEWLKQSAR